MMRSSGLFVLSRIQWVCGYPQHTPGAITAHTDGHQYRYVLDFTGSAALEYNAVQVYVGIFPYNRPVPPGLDVFVDIPVEVADLP